MGAYMPGKPPLSPGWSGLDALKLLSAFGVTHHCQLAWQTAMLATIQESRDCSEKSGLAAESFHKIGLSDLLRGLQVFAGHAGGDW